VSPTSCNCGGKGKNKTATTTTQKAGAGQGSRPTNIVPAQPVKSATGRTQTFTLFDGAGPVQSFGSRLEAEAARVRRGGTVYVTG